MKQVTVIKHVAFEDLGTLAIALKQHDYIITNIEAGVDNLSDLDPFDADLVVVLGGQIGAYEEKAYPFLTHELQFLEQRLASDLPTLGICLGAQLIARALGAKVYPGHNLEIGWSTIALSEAGKRSPLIHLASESTSVLHWHGDTFDQPIGATHLASTATYPNQAFSWGQHCLALQFHPEVTAIGLERWFIGHASEIRAANLTVAELRQETSLYARRLEKQAAQVWQTWLAALTIG
ncbi:MAG: glutamine amidotransferase [Stenomitos rutilans HA7619-LM2]|nr:glutamine amidotransferase [Stenomitos rutilans HA7619-LM2]